MWEDDPTVLKEAAMDSSDRDAAAFAFCRLTGYSRAPDACDAYSYRTYACGLMKEMDREGILGFCREMIRREGPFAKEAQEWADRLREISDEDIAEWKEPGDV